MGDSEEEETRSGLFFHSIRIIKEMREHDKRIRESDQLVRSAGDTDYPPWLRPRWTIYENVKGALSSSGGYDFKAVIEQSIRVVEPEAPDLPMPEKDGPSMEWFTIPTESGALPGLSMMPNFSEFRSGDPGWLFCVTTGEYVPVKSSLSSILEENADPSLNLSEKACQGILNRAEKRGKELPEELRKALERQAKGIGSTEYKLSEQRERTDQADHPMSSSASEEERPFVMN